MAKKNKHRPTILQRAYQKRIEEAEETLKEANAVSHAFYATYARFALYLDFARKSGQRGLFNFVADNYRNASEELGLLDIIAEHDRHIPKRTILSVLKLAKRSINDTAKYLSAQVNKALYKEARK